MNYVESHALEPVLELYLNVGYLRFLPPLIPFTAPPFALFLLPLPTFLPFTHSGEEGEMGDLRESLRPLSERARGFGSFGFTMQKVGIGFLQSARCCSFSSPAANSRSLLARSSVRSHGAIVPLSDPPSRSSRSLAGR